MIINDNLHYIKKVLVAPYHFFTFSPKNTNLIVLNIEDKTGRRVQFTGPSIWQTVEEAHAYVINEIKAGTLKDIVDKTTKKQEEVEVKENKKDKKKDEKE